MLRDSIGEIRAEFYLVPSYKHWKSVINDIWRMDAVSDSTNFAHKSVKSSTNVFFLLPTKFLQPVNLDTFTT